MKFDRTKAWDKRTKKAEFKSFEAGYRWAMNARDIDEVCPDPTSNSPYTRGLRHGLKVRNRKRMETLLKGEKPPVSLRGQRLGRTQFVNAFSDEAVEHLREIIDKMLIDEEIPLSADTTGESDEL